MEFDTLFKKLDELGPCAVAFSGGVDSCVLARAAVESARKNGWKVAAFTAQSPSMTQLDAETIPKIAAEIGIPHEFVPTFETELPEYRTNTEYRCYFCKRHILSQLQKAANDAGFSVLAEGSNADDLNDFRPGFKAVQEFHVRSPLCEAGLTKEDVRNFARKYNLSTSEKPSTPCLASRIAYGIEITSERLSQVERAEAFLADWGVQPLRVRVHENGLARIETDGKWIDFLAKEENRTKIITFFKTLGFRWVCVNLGGFRSGSLNAGK